MAPPFGNKYGVGKGRPPIYESDEEIKALGEELLAWMKEIDSEKKPKKIVHLSQWYSEVKGLGRTEWENIRKRACFLLYYERALEWMGNKWLSNPELPQSYGNRFLSIYFKDVREEERAKDREKIDYEYEKKAAMEASRGVSPHDSKLDELINAVKASNGPVSKADSVVPGSKPSV